MLYSTVTSRVVGSESVTMKAMSWLPLFPSVTVPGPKMSMSGTMISGTTSIQSDQALRVPGSGSNVSVIAKVQVPEIDIRSKMLRLSMGRNAPEKGALPSLIEVLASSSR